MFLKALLFAVMLLLLFATEETWAVDEAEQAANDFALGLMGLKEAASNPALLAQLMQDMQVR